MGSTPTTPTNLKERIKMKEISNPLDYLIECCDSAINTGKWKLTRFTVLNAKDELKKIRQKIHDMTQEAFDANKFATEEMSRNLDYEVVGWARINDRGDIYDLRVIHNQYVDQSTVLPIYANKKEYEAKHGNLSK